MKNVLVRKGKINIREIDHLAILPRRGEGFLNGPGTIPQFGLEVEMDPPGREERVESLAPSTVEMMRDGPADGRVHPQRFVLIIVLVPLVAQPGRVDGVYEV